MIVNPVCPPNFQNATGYFVYKCVDIYVPPQPLDIRYWWIGFTIMLIVTMMLLGFAHAHGVQIGSSTFIYLFMIGLQTGGWVAVLANVMSWVIPLTIFVAMILYAWRTRG